MAKTPVTSRMAAKLVATLCLILSLPDTGLFTVTAFQARGPLTATDQARSTITSKSQSWWSCHHYPSHDSKTVCWWPDSIAAQHNLHDTQLLLTRQRVGRTALSLGATEVSSLASSIFRTSGAVPLGEAFGINAFLFALLNQKLFTMLTPTGFAHSLALGTMLWATLGWKGWMFCVSYLFLGQLVTKVRFSEKEKKGLAEGRGGRRGPENVWGSAATGLLCAACSAKGSTFLGIGSQVFLLGYVASLATKLADTFASEIGKAYGKTTFLITTMERVKPGTEGAVSLEGTAASVVGGLTLSLIGYFLGLIHSLPAILVSTLAAFIATNVESVMGATLQDKEGLKWITNEVINFLNTLIGAAIAMVLGLTVLGMA